MLNKWRFTSLATVLAVLLTPILVGCGDGTGVGDIDGGRVQFVLSAGDAGTLGQASGATADGPLLSDGDGDRDGDGHQWFQSASVTFSSFLARNLDGVLVNVDMELPATVDVLALRDSEEVSLPAGVLPPATYDQLVVVMTQVEVVTHDGTGIAITPPGGGWTAIVPVCPFEVVDGETTSVGLRFMGGKAFSWRHGRHHFRPHFECDGGDPEPEPQP
jgi:hypothetical protein